MKKGLQLGFVVGAALLWAIPADASGCRNSAGACCGPTVGCCAPVVNCAPVQYVEQKVTAYRCVPVEKEVEVTVNKLVPTQENYKYVEYTYSTTQEKRTITTCQVVQEPVQYKYYVNKLVTTPEKRKVIECVPVTREVEYKYVEYLSEPVKSKQQVTTWTCQPKTVEQVVTVCKRVLVPVDCGSPCGGCGGCGSCGPRYACQVVQEQQKVACTVFERVPVVSEVEVVTYKCTPVEKVGKRLVCEYKQVEKEITVNVTTCVPVEQVGTSYVCKTVPVTKEIVVNVPHCLPVEKTGTRTVYTCVPTKEKVKVVEYVQQPYETVVKVAVPCASSCYSGCGYSYGCCR